VNRDERIGRSLVYLQTLGTALAYVLAIFIADAFYVARHVRDSGMAFGYSFVLVQGGAVGLLFSLSIAIKAVRYSQERRWERLRPLILEKALASLSGSGGTAEMAVFARRNPMEVDRCVAELLACVEGEAHGRLAQMAAGLGLLERWKEQYRSTVRSKRMTAVSRLAQLHSDAAIPTLILALEDPDDEIRLEASRALIRSSGEKEIEAVFHAATRDSLLVRAVLAEALRPHAATVSRSALPAALANADAKIVRTALEIVRAWGRSLPLPATEPLLRHPDAGVRAAALSVLPLLPNPRRHEAEILGLLSDPDESVRVAAVGVSGKLRLASAAGPLRTCLEQGPAMVTVAAAYALAKIGPEGCRALEEQVLASRTRPAAAALEALEQVRSGRMLLAGL